MRMEERLETRIDEEKKDQLIGRIEQLYAEGVLRVRDWIAIYDIMLEACERDKAETLEDILVDSLNEKEEGDIND